MANSAQPLTPKAITYDTIKIKSPWEILSIENFVLTKKTNEHTCLNFSALISEEASKDAALTETDDDVVECLVETDDDSKVIFKGILKEIKVTHNAGNYILSAFCLSYTAKLDVKEKSRSFQDINSAYSDIAKEILNDYPGKNVRIFAENIKIAGPVIQYKETDWQFLKRLASYQETVIVPNAVSDSQILSFGFPKGAAVSVPPDIGYSSGKNLKGYHETVAFKPDANLNNYTYFDVETYQELDIGNQVNFNHQNMSVSSITAVIKDGVLVYSATLVKESAVRQNPVYNSKLRGISLEGKVLSVENQAIKLELTIDKEMGRTQDEQQAYPFSFAPPTVDMMYLMPEKGTMASLYIPAIDEKKAIITGQVRTNGQSCDKTGDPNTRYLTNAHGHEFKLSPGGVAFTAKNNDLLVNLEDEQGVTLSSHKELSFSADEEILFTSKKKVSFTAASLVLMKDPSAKLSIENEINLKAPLVKFGNFAVLPDVANGTDNTEETNYFYDSDRADRVLSPFKQINWENLPRDEKKAAIQELADYNADILGIKDKPDIKYEQLENGVRGSYNNSLNRIRINEDILDDDGSNVARTVSHEYRHKYQWQRKENPTSERDRTFSENLEPGNYINGRVDYEGYRNQPVEADANAYGNRMKNHIDNLP